MACSRCRSGGILTRSSSSDSNSSWYAVNNRSMLLRTRINSRFSVSNRRLVGLDSLAASSRRFNSFCMIVGSSSSRRISSQTNWSSKSGGWVFDRTGPSRRGDKRQSQGNGSNRFYARNCVSRSDTAHSRTGGSAPALGECRARLFGAGYSVCCGAIFPAPMQTFPH